MKNHNYNLVKQLHDAVDSAWRIEKHYQDDVKDLPCDCAKLLKEIREDNERHAKMLAEEIAKHNFGE